MDRHGVAELFIFVEDIGVLIGHHIFLAAEVPAVEVIARASGHVMKTGRILVKQDELRRSVRGSVSSDLKLDPARLLKDRPDIIDHVAHFFTGGLDAVDDIFILYGDRLGDLLALGGDGLLNFRLSYKRVAVAVGELPAPEDDLVRVGRGSAHVADRQGAFSVVSERDQLTRYDDIRVFTALGILMEGQKAVAAEQRRKVDILVLCRVGEADRLVELHVLGRAVAPMVNVIRACHAFVIRDLLRLSAALYDIPAVEQTGVAVLRQDDLLQALAGADRLCGHLIIELVGEFIHGRAVVIQNALALDCGEFGRQEVIDTARIVVYRIAGMGADQINREALRLKGRGIALG